MYRHTCVLGVCDNTVGRMQHAQATKDISAYVEAHNLWARSGWGYATSAAWVSMSKKICTYTQYYQWRNVMRAPRLHDSSTHTYTHILYMCTQSARLQFPLSHLFVFHFYNHFAYSHCSTHCFCALLFDLRWFHYPTSERSAPTWRRTNKVYIFFTTQKGYVTTRQRALTFLRAPFYYSRNLHVRLKFHATQNNSNNNMWTSNINMCLLRVECTFLVCPRLHTKCNATSIKTAYTRTHACLYPCKNSKPQFDVCFGMLFVCHI